MHEWMRIQGPETSCVLLVNLNSCCAAKESVILCSTKAECLHPLPSRSLSCRERTAQLVSRIHECLDASCVWLSCRPSIARPLLPPSWDTAACARRSGPAPSGTKKVIKQRNPRLICAYIVTGIAETLEKSSRRKARLESEIPFGAHPLSNRHGLLCIRSL
jgi:hypothetical protein